MQGTRVTARIGEHLHVVSPAGDTGLDKVTLLVSAAPVVGHPYLLGFATPALRTLRGDAADLVADKDGGTPQARLRGDGGAGAVQRGRGRRRRAPAPGGGPLQAAEGAPRVDGPAREAGVGEGEGEGGGGGWPVPAPGGAPRPSAEVMPASGGSLAVRPRQPGSAAGGAPRGSHRAPGPGGSSAGDALSRPRRRPPVLLPAPPAPLPARPAPSGRRRPSPHPLPGRLPPFAPPSLRRAPATARTSLPAGPAP